MCLSLKSRVPDNNVLLFQVISYGATITSIQVPDKKGVPDDVVAGFDTLEGTFTKWFCLLMCNPPINIV